MRFQFTATIFITEYICTFARLKQRGFLSTLRVRVSKKICDAVCRNIMLNVFKYFKDESLNFPPRSYLRGSDGLASWICQSAKPSTASSSATQVPVLTSPALPDSPTTSLIETSPSATRKVHPRTIILDDTSV